MSVASIKSVHANMISATTHLLRLSAADGTTSPVFLRSRQSGDCPRNKENANSQTSGTPQEAHVHAHGATASAVPANAVFGSQVHPCLHCTRPAWHGDPRFPYVFRAAVCNDKCASTLPDQGRTDFMCKHLTKNLHQLQLGQNGPPPEALQLLLVSTNALLHMASPVPKCQP